MLYAAAATLLPHHPDLLAMARLPRALNMPKCVVENCPAGHVHLHTHFEIPDSEPAPVVIADWECHLAASVTASFGQPVRLLEHRVTCICQPPSSPDDDDQDQE